MSLSVSFMLPITMRDPTGAIDIIHWTTEGKHYKVDFITFSHLLGLSQADRTAPELTEYEVSLFRSTSICILMDIQLMDRQCI